MVDQETEIYKQHRQHQDKYTYFLLAAAGAAIGFALTQTRIAALSWSHLPLGVAALLWGASFWAGCARLHWIDSILFTNSEMLRIQRGAHPEVGQHPQMIAAAAEGIRNGLDRQGRHAQDRATWQFRLLILGALFYIAWHVWEMYERAANVTAVVSP